VRVKIPGVRLVRIGTVVGGSQTNPRCVRVLYDGLRERYQISVEYCTIINAEVTEVKAWP